VTTKPVHQFTVGAFDCSIVQDGTFAYPHPARTFFVNAPESEREQVLRNRDIDPEHWDEYVSPYPCLVVETSDHTALIDTGAGDLGPTTGNLRVNLAEAGIEPEDVDTVLLTHAHPDHIGGCVDDEGEPAFPDARYIMSDTEWEFWTSEPDLSGLGVGDDIKSVLRDVPRETLPAVEEQLELVDSDAETEVVPGVRTLPAPGHTPGHMAVSVASDDDRLLHLVDTVLHPIHLARPGWYGATDYDPEQVVTTRNRLLEEAASEHVPVLAFHFPAPGLGHVVQAGETWEWQPVEG
jgi:glyoxylase-like metal-dependent hydrolase (beta-lactamase superfamily II)